ncbi:SLATT domain-containing protein [Vibrio cholerae]
MQQQILSGVKSMELNSQIEILESQIRECFGRVVWTHKTHEKCADILNKRQNQIKFWQILLSALTTSGVFVTVFGEYKAIGIASAFISLLLTIINTYVKKYDLGALAQKHADTAVSVWNIREKYFSLLTDIKARTIDIESIKVQRDILQAELHKHYKGSPRTISKAYIEASKALKEMEEMTFSDEEIDKFLPKPLKRNA